MELLEVVERRHLPGHVVHAHAVLLWPRRISRQRKEGDLMRGVLANPQERHFLVLRAQLQAHDVAVERDRTIQAAHAQRDVAELRRNPLHRAEYIPDDW